MMDPVGGRRGSRLVLDRDAMDEGDSQRHKAVQNDLVTFTPPPGWPPVNPGWLPASGWQPLQAWPPPPEGWVFYRGPYGEPAGPPQGSWVPIALALSGESPDPGEGSPQERAASTERGDGSLAGSTAHGPVSSPRSRGRSLMIGLLGLAVILAIGGGVFFWRWGSEQPSAVSGQKWIAPVGCPSADEIDEWVNWQGTVTKYSFTDRCFYLATWQTRINTVVDADFGVRTHYRPWTMQEQAGAVEMKQVPELGVDAIEIRYDNANIRDNSYPGCVLSVPLTETVSPGPEGQPQPWLIVNASSTDYPSYDHACTMARAVLNGASSPTP